MSVILFVRVKQLSANLIPEREAECFSDEEGFESLMNRLRDGIDELNKTVDEIDCDAFVGDDAQPREETKVEVYDLVVRMENMNIRLQESDSGGRGEETQNTQVIPTIQVNGVDIEGSNSKDSDTLIASPEALQRFNGEDRDLE